MSRASEALRAAGRGDCAPPPHAMRVALLEQRPGAAPLFDRLRRAGCAVVSRVADLDALDEALTQVPSDVIVVDLTQDDRDRVERVGALGRRHERPVAVFVDETDSESIQRAVRAGVSSYVVRGAHVERLRDALEVARVRFLEDRALRAELATARSSLADRKLIERAKGLLMRREALDEQSAYDALRREAMRSNCRIVDVAKTVLSEEAKS